MISEYWILENAEGRGSDLILVTTPTFSWKELKNTMGSSEYATTLGLRLKF
jgi:hypothetical protein